MAVFAEEKNAQIVEQNVALEEKDAALKEKDMEIEALRRQLRNQTNT